MGRIRMTTKLGVAVMAGALASQAAAEPDVFQPLEPDARDLAPLRWEKRLVLLFAPSAQDADYARQMALFKDVRGALKERDIVVLSDVDARTPSHLRQGFQPSGFKMVLVGKDGGVKLERNEVIAPEDLFSVIDAMPMRQREASN